MAVRSLGLEGGPRATGTVQQAPCQPENGAVKVRQIADRMIIRTVPRSSMPALIFLPIPKPQKDTHKTPRRAPRSSAKDIGRTIARNYPSASKKTVIRSSCNVAASLSGVLFGAATVCGKDPVWSRLCELAITGFRGVRDLPWP